MENLIKTSVRNLIEFVMRSGDIDTSYISQNRAVLGIKAHQKLQNEYQGDYTSEYYLKNETRIEDMVFLVEGRCDGIIVEDDKIIIDEIKSTTRNLENLDIDQNPLHWAQAMCYAYFYSVIKNLEEIEVQLSYYNIESEQTKRFRKNYSKDQLKHFYEELLLSYLDFSKKLLKLRNTRNDSVKALEFPFQSYRKGQREMAEAVYTTILKREKLFLEAPTGIGKTMSSLFPAIKSLGEGLADKVFYLTARSTTKDSANNAIDILMKKGLFIKCVTFTSKEKSCINDRLKCNPKDCPYAKGHFDRVSDAIEDIIDNEDIIDFATIISYCQKYKVCPFEFQLDIGIYADIVICDYNYAFDPMVYLKRFFDTASEEFVFLVDESHNLVDRGREMFSKEIKASDILDLIEEFTGDYLPIRKTMAKLLSKFEEKRPFLVEKRGTCLEEAPEDIYYLVKSLTSKMDTFLGEEKLHPNYEKILNLYFELVGFIKIYDLYDKGYRSVFSLDDEDRILVKLLCIDTSSKFKEILTRARATVFFSATLTPIDFYLKLLGGDESSYKYHLESPFEQKNLFIATAASISTRYNDRLGTSKEIASLLTSFVNSKKGNYLIFFPSYAYLELVYNHFIKQNEKLDIIKQDKKMSEVERVEFLNQFEDSSEKIAFAVLGGVFAEGIDLVGNRLIGSAIISVGLPGLSFERGVIKDYFNEKEGKGFEYAYQYPGMNKILQAAGRVIRQKSDRGSVLLIDKRFQEKSYRMLMPSYWSHMRSFYESESLEESLKEFWENC